MQIRWFGAGRKQKKELEELLTKVAGYASNNYKDAAQQAFRDFLNRFGELKAENALTPAQLDYYEQMKSKYEQELKGFRH
jgi:hypothetical protein